MYTLYVHTGWRWRHVCNKSIQEWKQSGNAHSERTADRQKEFIIKRIGETYIAYPADDPWYPLRQTIGTFPQEYMIDREQPEWSQVAEREDF